MRSVNSLFMFLQSLMSWESLCGNFMCCFCSDFSSIIIFEFLSLMWLRFIFFQCCCYRYLREDKPHGSAGGLYNFRDRIMEDNPVAIFSSIPYFMHLSVHWNKQKCQIWCGHHFSPFKFLTKFWFWSGYWALMLLSPVIGLTVAFIFTELWCLLQFPTARHAW